MANELAKELGIRAYEIVAGLAKSGLSHEKIVADAYSTLTREFVNVPESTIKTAVEWVIL